MLERRSSTNTSFINHMLFGLNILIQSMDHFKATSYSLRCLLIILLNFTSPTYGVKLTNMYVKDNQPALQAGNIELVCSATEYELGTIGIFKTDSPGRNSSEDQLSLCANYKCLPSSIQKKYNFYPSIDGVTINIQILNRSEDQKWWHCVDSSGNHEFLHIEVYTLPNYLVYQSVPVESKDVSKESVSLRCESNCVYPQPSIAWFYVQENTVHEYRVETDTHGFVDECIDQEKKFSSTLIIPKYTTFENNSDTTVTFKCGIVSFPGLVTAVYSPESSDIRFAVRVTGVTLRDGGDIPDTLSITVTSGEVKRVSCVSSLSRPPPTIVWYIGNTERQRSTNSTFSFIPVNTDHGETIYCKVFNIPPEASAVSSTLHNLYVNVAVSTVTLRDGNNNANSTIIATEGVFRTLVCEPGLSRPDPFISWYIGGPLKQNSSHKAYTFIPTDAYHNKVIYCTAASSKSVESEKAILYIRVPPKVTSKESFFGEIGQPIAITIPFYSRPVYTLLRLRRGSSDLNEDARYTITANPANVSVILDTEEVVLDGYTVIISIVNLTKVDMTSFYLEIENDVGVLIWKFAVKERIKPSSPLVLQNIEQKSMSLLYFEENSNGGYQQTFQIETSPVGKDVWTERLTIQEGDENYQLPCGSYIAGIEGLAPGEYSVRLLAKNKLGMSDAVLLSSPLTITGTPDPQTESVSVAAVAGGTVASVVIVIAVLTGVVIFFRKRQGTTGKTEGRQRKETGIRMKTQESNTVPQFSNEDLPTQSVGQMDEARNVYEKIDPDMRHGDPYESLELEAVSADYEKTDDKSYENV